MGFEEDLRAILQKAPVERQTLLFSATYPDAILQLSAGYQRAPLRLTVDLEMAEGQLQQSFFEVRAAAFTLANRTSQKTRYVPGA
jgi:superfamily II DNA/RNA helicase